MDAYFFFFFTILYLYQHSGTQLINIDYTSVTAPDSSLDQNADRFISMSSFLVCQAQAL